MRPMSAFTLTFCIMTSMPLRTQRCSLPLMPLLSLCLGRWRYFELRTKELE
ncbi:hypothetical protein FOTG_18811 [Fusarium oxysporum f. sp. vasinfectum 25433]|uniref:Uncharacterized protein n=1 Tax=Fusarium oxysporum f. sp. vasinfectum 25433 TaxID=1089449 RepID=X0LW36_FUSOX|nr:hypothetical protein FOTG_18811 [Fusarium oxysporum f. sp. vasinfectum 25433]